MSVGRRSRQMAPRNKSRKGGEEIPKSKNSLLKSPARFFERDDDGATRKEGAGEKGTPGEANAEIFFLSNMCVDALSTPTATATPKLKPTSCQRFQRRPLRWRSRLIRRGGDAPSITETLRMGTGVHDADADVDVDKQCLGWFRFDVSLLMMMC